MTPRATLPLTAALVCAVLAGCGNDDAGTSSATATPPPATQSASVTPTDPASSATTEPAAATSPSASETGRDSAPSKGASRTSEPRTTVITNSAAPTAPRTTPTAKSTSKTEARGTVPQRSIEDYGDAAVAAWSNGDRAALGRYVSPRVKTAATPPAGELLRVACDGDMCSYTTPEGKRVTLTFDRAAVKAGRTGGVVGVKVD
ncbi:hypothetical protein [Mobilicoccus pelagius]|uniref:Uncharacterized protein n=1 Tax=Mobilicoccus pelagius NBRC 104925 TaxID=1089455 RepID=H5UUG8_9MICO|nr:hypothetical protein [Mobilicoccus pelagius]GAB49376.1 hypothetical protein MOPEL_129_00190 [Mobilicoccus pelagius NBRC 104925]